MTPRHRALVLSLIRQFGEEAAPSLEIDSRGKPSIQPSDGTRPLRYRLPIQLTWFLPPRAIGYFYRVFAFLAVSLDLMKCANAIASHLLAVDRATMTPEHRQASEARDKAFMAQFRRDAGQALLNVLRPSYDPATSTPTPQATAYLASDEMTDAL